MKTKTFLLICFLTGFGFARLNAQTDVYRWQNVGGIFPVTCDGINVEFLECVGTLHWLRHTQHDVFTWVKAEVNWTATSSTGEVFKGRELDPGIEIYDADGNWIKETGTWRAVLIGDQGTHLKVTWKYEFDGVNWTWEFLEAKCH